MLSISIVYCQCVTSCQLLGKWPYLIIWNGVRPATTHLIMHMPILGKVQDPSVNEVSDITYGVIGTQSVKHLLCLTHVLLATVKGNVCCNSVSHLLCQLGVNSAQDLTERIFGTCALITSTQVALPSSARPGALPQDVKDR